MAARQRDPVTPAGVDVVELGQIREPPRRPEPRLVIADGALDRPLLPRRLGRAGVRVEGVVAAQLREPRIPVDDLTAVDALAAGDRRPEVVIDTLARNAAQPLERPDMALQKGLDRHVEREVRRRRPRERQRADQRVDAPLPAGDPRPRRHLSPIDLQHLPRPIARLLRRPLRPRPQHRQPLADQINRPAVAVLIAQDLGHPRRLDLRPPLEQPAQHHRLQRIQHRPRRRPRIARRLRRLDQLRRRPPVDPQPPCDLASSRPHPRPSPSPQPTPTRCAPPSPPPRSRR